MATDGRTDVGRVSSLCVYFAYFFLFAKTPWKSVFFFSLFRVSGSSGVNDVTPSTIPEVELLCGNTCWFR